MTQTEEHRGTGSWKPRWYILPGATAVIKKSNGCSLPIYDIPYDTRQTMELRVPKLKKPGGSIFKTNPESLKKWVENLPLVDIETSAGQLEFGLSEINGVELPSRDRLEVLELLTSPVMHVTRSLEKKYLGKRFPLGKDHLNKSNRVIDLYLAMATGYKLLVAALDRETNADTLLATPMQRAIRYLSESLIAGYQIYSQHRTGIWEDLHTLYALAAKHGLQARQVSDTTLQKPDLTTVEIAYKQILLLSLAGPYCLRQDEIRLVYNLLGQWVPFSRLLEVKNHDNIGFFSCHLASDDPPSCLVPRQRDRLDDDWRILDTSGMKEPAKSTLTDLRDKPGLRNVLPGESTLKRLMLAWGVIPERQSNRRRQEDSIQLVLGINAIHNLLTEPGSGDTGAAMRETLVADRDDFLYDPTLERPTVIATNHHARCKTTGSGWQNNGALTGANHPLRGAFALEPQGNTAGANTALSIESWKMVDVSTGGYCLLWESSDVSTAQVGELIAIRTGGKGSYDDWTLGVIRWMKFTPKRGLVLGAQLLGSGATPVRASLCGDKSATGNRSRGILLPESKPLKQQASLLLPSLQFRAGCLSTLTRDGREEKIILVRQMENTGSFSQFHFTMATES
jgi:cyclic-di-GMP-binding protein